MKFHWTGQNHGAAVEFFMEVEDCIGVVFDGDTLLVKVGEHTLHFEAGTNVEFMERSE